MAVASLILGILGLMLSFVFIGIFPAILGAIFGIISLKQNKNGMATAGLVCSIVGICIFAIMLIGSPDSGSTSGTGNQSAKSGGNLAEQMDVKTYSYMTDYARMAVFYITNTADKDVGIDMNVIAKDSAGQAVASASPYETTIAPGTSAVLTAYLEGASASNEIEYTMNVSENTLYRSAMKDIQTQYNIVGNKVVLTATNNGSEPVYYLHGYVIFFNKGSAVYCNDTYLIGGDDTIKPGETRSGDVECYAGTYDDILIGFTGHYKD